MNEKCSIVQDLLPLYTEDMVRAETRGFIDTHLAGCADCQSALSALRADVPAAPEVNAAPLRGIRRELWRQKLTAVLLAVALALTLAFSGYAYLTAPQYLSYNEVELALLGGVTTESDDLLVDTVLSTSPLAVGTNALADCERVQIILLTPASGMRVERSCDENGNAVYFISAWRTLMDEWRGVYDEASADGDALGALAGGSTETEFFADSLRQTESTLHDGGIRTLTLDADTCTAIYYAQNNGSDDVLLLGAQPTGYGGTVTLPRLALGYYLLLALLLGAALGIAWVILRRKTGGKTLGYLALVPLSYAMGHLLVKGFSSESYNMTRDLSLILLVGALVYCAALLARALWRKR